jgi:hypothetical protein
MSGIGKMVEYEARKKNKCGDCDRNHLSASNPA